MTDLTAVCSEIEDSGICPIAHKALLLVDGIRERDEEVKRLHVKAALFDDILQAFNGVMKFSVDGCYLARCGDRSCEECKVMVTAKAILGRANKIAEASK